MNQEVSPEVLFYLDFARVKHKVIIKLKSVHSGFGCSSHEKFKSHIQQSYGYDLGELESIARKICELYIEMGAVSNVQIDSFVYREKITGTIFLQLLSNLFVDC